MSKYPCCVLSKQQNWTDSESWQIVQSNFDSKNLQKMPKHIFNNQFIAYFHLLWHKNSKKFKFSAKTLFYKSVLSSGHLDWWLVYVHLWCCVLSKQQNSVVVQSFSVRCQKQAQTRPSHELNKQHFHKNLWSKKKIFYIDYYTLQ